MSVQCYRYPDSDNVHYEYFDYITTNDADERVIEQFLPDSDFDFLPFKAAIREEWAKRK